MGAEGLVLRRRSEDTYLLGDDHDFEAVVFRERVTGTRSPGRQRLAVALGIVAVLASALALGLERARRTREGELVSQRAKLADAERVLARAGPHRAPAQGIATDASLSRLARAAARFTMGRRVGTVAALGLAILSVGAAFGRW